MANRHWHCNFTGEDRVTLEAMADEWGTISAAFTWAVERVYEQEYERPTKPSLPVAKPALWRTQHFRLSLLTVAQIEELTANWRTRHGAAVRVIMQRAREAIELERPVEPL